MTTSEHTRAHRLRLMAGRDPDEQHRTVTRQGIRNRLTWGGQAAESVVADEFRRPAQSLGTGAHNCS